MDENKPEQWGYKESDTTERLTHTHTHTHTHTQVISKDADEATATT